MKKSPFLLFAGLAIATLSITSCDPGIGTVTPTPEAKITNVATTKVISYDSVGAPADTISYTYTYDAQNRLVSKIGTDGTEEQYAYSATTCAITYVDPTNPTSNMTLNYSLDAKGRLSSAPIVFSGVPFGSITHLYNADDQLATTKFFVALLGDTSKTNYTWSAKNNIGISDVNSVTVNTFDVTKKELRNLGTEDISRTRNFNLVTKEEITASGQTDSNTYEYEFDAIGRVIKETVKMNGIITSLTTYTY